MKKLSLMLLLFGVMSQVKAENFITTLTNQVGPGVIHTKVLEPSKPWTINVLEIDLRNPYMTVESIKAGGRLGVKLRVGTQANNNSYPAHIPVGAINGDFYSATGPINAQVSYGEIVKLENLAATNPIYWSTIGFDAQNNPSITTNLFSGQISAQGSISAISDINTGRGIDDLILFNSYYGPSTGTDTNGTEVLVSAVTEWLVNDTIQCLVENIATATGDMTIIPGQVVLSGSGLVAGYLSNNFIVGDTVALYLELYPAVARMTQLMGGFPTIVRNGQNHAVAGYYEEGGSSTFHTDFHPRTAVGISADSTRLYFITVDGRQLASRGINLIELADFMLSIGVHHGINLDGGGSTTMIVRDEVENYPSDGSQRFVANSLIAFSSAPIDVLSSIQAEPDNYRLFLGETVRIIASGWDQYFNPIDIDLSQLVYSVESSLGTVNENGVFTATALGDSGWLQVDYNGMEDSTYLYLKSIDRVTISPQVCMADTITPLQFSLGIRDQDGQGQSIAANQVTWQSLNPMVGTIDSLGVFTGLMEGATEVVASCYGFTDTAQVTVVIMEGTLVVDPMDDLSTWTLSGVVYDSLQTSISVVDTPRTYGSGSFKLDYEFTRSATERSYIYLNTDIFITGIPESIDFDFLSDGYKHKAYVIVGDDDGDLFRSTISGYAQDTTGWDTLTAYTDNFLPLVSGSVLNYPVSIKQVRIRLGNSADVGEINSGTVYFDNLRVVYPGLAVVSDVVAGNPNRYRLGQNYPNPFNPNTVIPYYIPDKNQISLVVFDILGHRVRTLKEAEVEPGHYSIIWDGRNQAGEPVSTGIYIYQLKAGNIVHSRKMLLIK
ncbi:MAG: phosphodiester glycosidase family protein [Candidatus Marinimicrobia bacterium]|nr:phosphodiester glycosidase family protein [Candidatus Neomarinimicrobiota bacterium]